MTQAPDRIEALLNQSTVTGIDYVFVHADQQHLDVHFLRSPSTLNNPLHVDLALKDILIDNAEGSVAPVPVSAINWINSNETLQITTAAAGDFTIYRLAINDPRIDPYYNHISFSFKANCPSDLDCTPPAHLCPAEDWVDFPVDYQARDFWSYRRSLLEFASLRYPRVKVKIPSVTEDLQLWAMPCLPYAGNNVGVYMIPEPDAGVWVEFEGGDTSFPIWTGGYWVDEELPKLHDNSNATPPVRMIRSQKGLQISFNDDSEKFTISDKDGSNIMTIEVQQGKVRIEGNMKVVLQAPQIELVEDATHPVAFGDDLLQYLTTLVNTFNAHIHPGVAAGVLPVTLSPPLPPAVPPTPALLSVKVKTG